MVRRSCLELSATTAANKIKKKIKLPTVFVVIHQPYTYSCDCKEGSDYKSEMIENWEVKAVCKTHDAAKRFLARERRDLTLDTDAKYATHEIKEHHWIEKKELLE